MTNKTDAEKFAKEYLNTFPNDFLSWLEGFIAELDASYPEKCEDIYEYQRRIGAWETQLLVRKRLRFAVNAERSRIERGINDKTNIL
jgi:hypothetical protein